MIRAAVEEGKKVHVYADETRPVLQGARLTAWELLREGIPCTLITDNMAGFLMKKGEVDLVIVGADRIAANGDTANKIGTYGLAVLARAHGIPFYVAAPLSTIDPTVREGIPCTLITDNMAGFLMKKGEVDLVIVGADRIAANGDAANKIGTYGLAVLARAHGIPFYVAAPLSTIDPTLPDGEAIPIEERAADEVTHVGGTRTAPEGVAVWNPAFDVTPHELITAIVTEAGVIRSPFGQGIRRALSSPPSPPSR